VRLANWGGKTDRLKTVVVDQTGETARKAPLGGIGGDLVSFKQKKNTVKEKRSFNVVEINQKKQGKKPYGQNALRRGGGQKTLSSLLREKKKMRVLPQGQFSGGRCNIQVTGAANCSTTNECGSLPAPADRGKSRDARSHNKGEDKSRTRRLEGEAAGRTESTTLKKWRGTTLKKTAVQTEKHRGT